MLTVGVDVGGTSVRAGVVDRRGTILDTARVGTPSGAEALNDAIVSVISSLTARHAISAVGLAVAGFVATDLKTVMFAPHLAWRRADVADRISRKLDLPVVLEHDANAAALAEYRYGAARGAKVATLIAIGTGIGGGLLLDGKIFRGAHGVAPELGHLRVVPNGRPCSCGKSGCWERYCSGTALSATAIELLAGHPGQSTVLAREAAGDARSITGRKVAGAARDGDPVALRAMAELARWLGEGLALVADIYDPEVIVIAGGVSESAPLFLDDARELYRDLVTGSGYRPLARIRTAQLGDDAGLVGAATLARDVANGRH
ncbi:ROK family glucokinase [Kibdelosporangium phytohabitans]|uniref:Glucokinase n=1 Tax=Kibdelosporangium phytohabitans TaxID=860235 RepID=A0A0N9HS97_9PSEU|nr:ROK family glucokinase [Kibdelosporangium phytohabitans]ALG07806.1 glucokinase [Kibdelosporangium phytohabitans]MBE1471271.1 glucokinase [Kibdelosporangium phytohabitans]